MNAGRNYLLPVSYILFCQAVFIAVGHLADQLRYEAASSESGSFDIL
jgi:hypothetical protein